jgi:hypothetical protein
MDNSVKSKGKTNKELKIFKKKMREAFAEYYASEGCSCCRNYEKHNEAKRKIGKLLRVSPYADGSGYNFYKYEKKENK